MVLTVGLVEFLDVMEEETDELELVVDEVEDRELELVEYEVFEDEVVLFVV